MINRYKRIKNANTAASRLKSDKKKMNSYERNYLIEIIFNEKSCNNVKELITKRDQFDSSDYEIERAFNHILKNQTIAKDLFMYEQEYVQDKYRNEFIEIVLREPHDVYQILFEKEKRNLIKNEKELNLFLKAFLSTTYVAYVFRQGSQYYWFIRNMSYEYRQRCLDAILSNEQLTTEIITKPYEFTEEERLFIYKTVVENHYFRVARAIINDIKKDDESILKQFVHGKLLEQIDSMVLMDHFI